jgi:hypothetical protein
VEHVTCIYLVVKFEGNNAIAGPSRTHERIILKELSYKMWGWWQNLPQSQQNQVVLSGKGSNKLTGCMKFISWNNVMSRLDFLISNHFKTPKFRDDTYPTFISSTSGPLDKTFMCWMWYNSCHITFSRTFVQGRHLTWVIRKLTVNSPLSSHTRQRFPLYQVQCWIKLDNAFRCTRSNVELNSTTLSVAAGPVSK